MSEWLKPTYRARKAATTKHQVEVLDKVDRYLDNMVVKPLGYFSAPRIYRKNDSVVLNPDNDIDDKYTRDINFVICRVNDLNNRNETGRHINRSPGAREIYDTTTSYVICPLEQLIDGGAKTQFEDVKDISGTTRVFDPRLVALSTYPQEISDVAQMIKNQQELAFYRTYRTVNTDNELIEIGPKYYSALTENVLRNNPYLEQGISDENQQEE